MRLASIGTKGQDIVMNTFEILIIKYYCLILCLLCHCVTYYIDLNFIHNVIVTLRF